MRLIHKPNVQSGGMGALPVKFVYSSNIAAAKYFFIGRNFKHRSDTARIVGCTADKTKRHIGTKAFIVARMACFCQNIAFCIPKFDRPRIFHDDYCTKSTFVLMSIFNLRICPFADFTEGVNYGNEKRYLTA